MAKNRTRAARRNAERTRINALAREAALEIAEERRRPKQERARYVTQLELLRNRGNISARQYESGDQLYLDWRASGSEPRLVPAYDREVGHGHDGYQPYQVDARLRFEKAIKALGQRCRDVVVHVCLVDKEISEYPLSTADAMDRLRDGLNDLSIWYESVRRQHTVDRTPSDSVLMC